MTKQFSSSDAAFWLSFKIWVIAAVINSFVINYFMGINKNGSPDLVSIIFFWAIVFGFGAFFSLPVAIVLNFFFRSCFNNNFIKSPEIIFKAILIGSLGAIGCYFLFAFLFKLTASENIPMCIIAICSGIASIILMSFSIQKLLIKRNEEEDLVEEIGMNLQNVDY